MQLVQLGRRPLLCRLTFLDQTPQQIVFPEATGLIRTKKQDRANLIALDFPSCSSCSLASPTSFIRCARPMD